MLRKNIYTIVVTAVIVAAVLYGFIPKPLSVETAAVVTAPLSVTVDEEGKTRVIDRFIISAPVTGTVLRSVFNVGDAVIKGESIIEIEPRMSTVLDPRARAEAKAHAKAAKAALNAAKENLNAAHAKAKYTKNELKRIKKLHADGYVTDERLEKSVADARTNTAALRSVEFGVTVARYELDAAKTTLIYSGANPSQVKNGPVKVTAPVDGHILRVLHKSEGAVISGEDLLEVGDSGALEVEVDVISANAVRITTGTPVLFKRWGGAKPLTGTVRMVEPTGFTKVSALGVEEQRVLVIAAITSPRKEWKRLGDGYRVEASFILWQGANVLQVPTSAVFRHNGSDAVFTYLNSKAVLTPVTLGHSSGLNVEVLTGLSEAQLVITHPDNSLNDGSKVRTIN